MDTALAENISESLVREYLSRKGLKDTLARMDDELPRGDSSIKNRGKLIEALHIQRIMDKNKTIPSPHKTMLEVIIQFKCLINSDSSGGTKQSIGVASSDLVLEDTDDGETVVGEGVVSYQEEDRSSGSAMRRGNRAGLSGPVSSNNGVQNARDRRRGNVPSSNEPKLSPLSNTSDQSQTGTAGLRLAGRGLETNGRSLSEKKEEKKTATFTKADFSSPTSRKDPIDDILSPKVNSPLKSPLDFSSSRNNKPDDAPLDFSSSSSASSSSRHNKPKSSWSSDVPSVKPVAKPRFQSNAFGSEDIETPDSDALFSNPASESRKPKPVSHSKLPSFLSNKAESTTVGDIEFGDIDDLELEAELNELELEPVSVPRQQAMIITNAKPMDSTTACALKKLIFGAENGCFNDEWRLQGFTFCSHAGLRYGMVQKKGGSCGVMASVQAAMLRQLLFAGSRTKTIDRSCLECSSSARSDALARALATIFWRAGNETQAIVTIPANRPVMERGGSFKADRITETLMLNPFDSYASLETFMLQQVAHFEADGSGVILCLYSTILSRGIARVIEDMDEPEGKLMGQYHYCSQDMVNLISCGQASANVFNNIVELESGGATMILKGISKQAEMGLLSLFEHYQSVEVGSYLKTPHYPIWVVCSESHFSVMFCLRRELLTDYRAERRFDLYYYDGLARQDEEIRLTVDTSDRYYKPPEGDLVPPLEHCIRTKWQDACVEWNGTEPLL